MKSHVYKWKWVGGENLTTTEYKTLFNKAKAEGIPLEEYMEKVGVEVNLSYGEVQNPVKNSAKLVSWYKNVGGKNKFLTLWKYNKYLEEASSSGKDIATYLRERGFKPLKEMKDENGDNATRWIDLRTGKIIFRKEYMRLYALAKKNNMSINSFMKLVGIDKLLESKRRMIYK